MTTTRAGIYCRISKDRSEEALGVDRQEKDCRELAKRLGVEVVSTFTDNDVSAYSGKTRPQYVAMVEAIEARQITTLIVWNQDRLNRSPRELEDLVDLVERTGCEIHAVTMGEIDLMTPEGRLVARITGAAARKESESMSRRIKRKLVELRESGKPTGRLAYCYEAGGVLNPERHKIVLEVAERILAGESCGLIADDLTRREVPTRSGGKWTHTSVRRMMRSPSLVSLIMHEGELVGVGNWPPALDRATWDRCGAAMVQTPRTPNSNYLLSGLAKCGLCGQGLTGAIQYQRGERIGVYGCRKQHGGCGHIHIRRVHLEAEVLQRITAMLSDPAMTQAGDDGGDLADQIAAADARLVEYAALLDDGELEIVEWRELRGRAAERIKALRERQTAAVPVDVNAGEEWDHMSTARRRQIIAAFMEVTVHPGARGPRFDPERVRIRWIQ